MLTRSRSETVVVPVGANWAVFFLTNSIGFFLVDIGWPNQPSR